jgi:elongation factor G
MAQEQERGITTHLLQQLRMEFPTTQGKILPETLPYHQYYRYQDTLTYSWSKPFFTRTWWFVFFFSAVDGVEPQSETNWRLADQYNKPERLVNKMDRQGLNSWWFVRADMLKSNAAAPL